MKNTSNIEQLRKRFGIRDHWGLSDTLVRLMAECPEFEPQVPGQAAQNHALRGTVLPAEFFRESALRMAREAEERPETISFIVLGQIIEYHTLADWLEAQYADTARPDSFMVYHNVVVTSDEYDDLGG